MKIDTFVSMIKDLRTNQIQDDTDPQNVSLQMYTSPYDEVVVSDSVRAFKPSAVKVWSNGTTYNATDSNGQPWGAPSCGWLWGAGGRYGGRNEKISYPLTWNANPAANLSIDTATGDLTKTAATSAWDTAAYSNEQITSGDGYVTTVVDEANAHRMIGLTHNETGSASYSDITFGMYLTNNGNIEIYENGVAVGAVSASYAQGDVIKVAVENGKVSYYKNDMVIYTSYKSVSYPLVVDTAFYTQNATLNNVRIHVTS